MQKGRGYMREILFRGKRKDNGEWVYGFYCYNPLMKRGEMFSFDAVRCYVYEVIPETIGQFTGLIDKNGTKIFEGDVVDILTENEEIGVVAYDDGGFLVNADGFCVDFHSNINGTDLEVIGNIHDNPEWVRKEGDI